MVQSGTVVLPGRQHAEQRHPYGRHPYGPVPERRNATAPDRPATVVGETGGRPTRGGTWRGPVRRIHFSSADLARVQVAASIGPLAEAVFSLPLVSRGLVPVYGEWQRQLATRLGPHLAAVRGLTAGLDTVPDLMWLLQGQSPPDGLAVGLGLSGPQVGMAVREYCRRMVMPYWPAVQNFLEAERDAHGRTLMSGGLEQLFAALDPRITWRSPVLEIPDTVSSDVHLAGRGLLLAPAVFLYRTPAVLVDAGPRTRPVLAFSAPPDLASAGLLWGTASADDGSLDALVGRTRSKLLRQTLNGSTTGELADQLGVSPASVSQHTRVLREAGLITTRRDKNRVIHSITSLGTAVLSGWRR